MTINKFNWLIKLVLLMAAAVVQAQEKEFVLTTGPHGLLAVPVNISIAELEFSANNDSSTINVYRKAKSGNILLQSQLHQSENLSLWFIPDAAIPANSKTGFIIKIEKPAPKTPQIPRVAIDAKNIHLLAGEQNALQYRYAFKEAPEEANPIYGKSGYLHPLYSPKGNVLTRIQPPDHYHHYGIWNPWTKTKVEGKEVDFWNLALGQGTVRYAGLLSKYAGPVFSGFKVKQEHVTFQNSGPDRVAINETWEIRNYPVEIDGRQCWLVEMIVTLNNNLDSKIELTNYRYGGGLGFRATEHWTNQNSEVLTSEGKTRINADGTYARWCKVEGAFPSGGNSGIVFLSHPDNRAHPEPMRVWPVDANNGRGDVYFEFCPIRHKKWDLMPGKEYVLKYRMLVFDGEFSAENAESVWQSFASEPSIKWK
jgi:hypothetical protein